MWYEIDIIRTMPASLLPAPDEVPALVPARDSVVWRYAGDARLLTTAGYALLLQVAHPTVGAGVSEHSNFKADPWGRLFRTLDYSYSMVYGGPRLAGEIGARVFEMHKPIRGKKPNGEPYHALEPDSYAWVHATLADAIITGNRLFGRPLAASEEHEFWHDWRRLGRVVGVREGELPETWPEFRLYFDEMVDEKLELTEAVGDVLESLRDPARPPLPGLGDTAWRVARFPAARAMPLVTAGLLPAVLRERFGLDWSSGHERRFRALAAASRATTPLLPRSLRNVGPLYLRRRHKAIARGDVASGSKRGSLASAA